MPEIEPIQTVLQQHFELVESRFHKGEVVAFLGAALLDLPTTDVKVNAVIGGVASGKTTISEELLSTLRQFGTAADTLSIDNYVKGDRQYRNVHLKEADAKEKYDLSLLDKHIGRIRTLRPGQTIRVPMLDKETGIAVDRSEADYDYEIGQVGVLVVEGDLPITDCDIQTFVYVPDKMRLQNYIDRSLAYKSTVDPADLVKGFNKWQRTTHIPYTLSALETADYVIASDAGSDDWEYSIYQRQTTSS